MSGHTYSSMSDCIHIHTRANNHTYPALATCWLSTALDTVELENVVLLPAGRSVLLAVVLLLIVSSSLSVVRVFCKKYAISCMHLYVKTYQAICRNAVVNIPNNTYFITSVADFSRSSTRTLSPLGWLKVT